MIKRKGKLEVVFYRTKGGAEPVREWLIKLSRADKKVIGEDIKTVQFGWPLGMPLVRYLAQGLWEVRIQLPRQRTARILFFMDESVMILVHGFIKKSQKIAKVELELAIKRKKQYQLA